MGGAAGVIVPYVETAAQVKAMVAAVKCRPIRGQRSIRHVSGEEPFTGELVESVRKGNALFVNIESAPAIENLDTILAVEGLDGIFIGPHDLSCQLGVPEQYSHPTFEKTVRHIWRKARAAGKGAGIHAICGDLQQEIRWMTEGGCNLITHSADLLAVTRMLSSGIAELRQAINATAKTEAKSFTI
jgi:4-hydroxy-2-oxoheptanedioate aldolase